MADKAKKTYSSKEFLREHGAKETKFRYTDSLNVEVVTATKHYSVGKQFRTHKLKAEALEKAGIVKILK